MRKRTRKPKSLRTFTKTVQREFNAMVTEDQPCAKCGNEYARMDCSHVLSIGAYPNLRFDILNVLPLDARCHRWWWHDEPTESGEWFRKKYPERWRYLEEAKNIIRKFTIEDLQEIRKAVEEKDFDKLILKP